MKSNIILVPHDFTPVADSALAMALELAHKNDGSVVLIHIVDKKGERIEARAKCRAILSELNPEDRDRTRFVVVEGDVFADIGKASEVLNASLIVMGTHGKTGMQKIFGSHALKVVNSTSTPFLLTHGVGNLTEIRTIVMPFYFEKETVQIATTAKDLAKLFGATIHLVGYYDKDQWLQEKTRSNEALLRRYFLDNAVEHEIVNLPKVASYESELQDYAVSVRADLFAAAHYNERIFAKNSWFVQILLDSSSEIPVLTVNTEEMTITSGLSFLTI